MTRRKWTKPPQETYLIDKRPEFRLAEANNTRKQFFDKLYPEWLARWPNREPTEDEIRAAQNYEQAVKVIYDAQLERLRSWYRNNKRPKATQKVEQGENSSAAPSTTSSLLKLKKKRKQQGWQAYHSLTYDKKWKSVIDEQWVAHVKEWKQTHPGEKMTETRFAFMNNFMKEKFKNETDEVKKEVEDYRIKQEEAKVVNINITYQDNIPKLPRTMVNVATGIENEAGWFTTIITGGPTPGDGGEINTYIYHHGTTPDGRNFAAFVGKKVFEESISQLWDNFLQEAFTPEMQAERAILDGDDSDSEDGLEEGTEEGENAKKVDEKKVDAKKGDAKKGDKKKGDKKKVDKKKVDEEKVDEEKVDKNADEEKADENADEEKADEEKVDKKGKEKEAVSEVREKSEYERTKELNIRQNKELLDRMGLGEGSTKLLIGQKEDKTSNRRTKKESSATTPSEVVVRRISPRNKKSTVDNSGSSGQAGSVEGTVVNSDGCDGGGKEVAEGGDIRDVPIDGDQGTLALNGGKRDDAQVDAEGKEAEQKDGVQVAAQAATKLLDNEDGNREEGVHDATLTDVNDTLKTTSDEAQALEQGPTPRPGGESNEEDCEQAMDVTDGELGDHSGPREDNEVAPMSGIDPRPNSDAVHKSDHAPIDTTKPINPDGDSSAPASAQDNINGSPSTSVQGNTDGSTSASYSLNMDITDAPSFLSMDIVKYLRQGSDHQSWQHLVNVYLTFEKKVNKFGKLSTTDRPRDIAPWIKRHVHKKHLPVEVQPTVYGPQFLAWWKAMQPSWRLLPEGGYSRETSSSEEKWTPIHKGGSAGLYVVMMALSWWVFSPDITDTGAMWDVVDDFAWVLKQLQSFHPASKRSLGSDTNIENVKVYKRSRQS